MGQPKKDITTAYPGLLEKLGTKPDAALGKEYGITQSRVYQFRVMHNVAAFEPEKSREPVAINHVFLHLRNLWQEQTGKDLPELAAILKVPTTRTADWAYGTAGRRPSWPALFQLSDLVNRAIVYQGGVVTVRRKPYATTQNDVVFTLGEGESW